MYAVLETGGKQYKVSSGDKLQIEKLVASVGDQLEFNNILLIADDKEVIVDPDRLKESKVTGEVLRQAQGRKIIVLKSKRKKGYKRKRGHRQQFTEVKIRDIMY